VLTGTSSSPGTRSTRFGATELQDRGIAEPLLREFFARMFTAFGVNAS
jgi:hypothetical protein